MGFGRASEKKEERNINRCGGKGISVVRGVKRRRKVGKKGVVVVAVVSSVWEGGGLVLE